MATGFDQAGVGFDDADYTFDGVFLGVAAGALFLSIYLIARNMTAGTSLNQTSADPASAATTTSANWVTA